MATVLSQSDTDIPFPDCSITSLLPRTLGSSFAAGAAKFESDDLDYVGSLFNSTEQANSRQLLEHAKMISNSNCLSIPNASLEGGNNILAMRIHDGQIDLQGKRARHHRPGLPVADRGGHVFNFSAKVTAAEFSQMGTSDDFFKRSRCVETNSVAANQFGPVIDYSCLEHISDPLEYFSTYRMLENVDKEVRKLKGESSPKLNQPQGRRDRQRRPGLHDLEGKKYVFKFPDMTSTTEESQIENSTQSHGGSINGLTITSCSKEISKINNSQTVEPESIVTGDEETCDKEIDELERLLSKCRKLDNDGIASVVRETLQINPIHVKKSRGFPFSVPTENKFESPQLSQILPVAKRNKIDGLSNLKGRLSWCDPFLPHRNDHDKQSDGSSGLGSNYKDFCVDGLEKLPSYEGGVLKEYLEKHKSDCNDISVDGITELEQEIFKTKLLDADEMANPVDHLSTFKMPIPLIDIQGRLAKISTLKRHMLQNTGEDEQLMLSNDGLKDSSFSKRQELHSVSPVDTTHFDDVSMDAQNACIFLSNLKRSNIEDKMHSLDTSEEDINLGKRTISDHIGRQSILLEETSQSPNGTISDENLVCIVSRAYFEQADQPAALVDHRSSEILANQSIDRLHQPLVSLRTTDNSDLYGFHCTSVEGNSDAPEQILHAEALDDDSHLEDSTLIDEKFEARGEVMNEKDKNQGCSEALGGPANRKLEREEPPCRQRKQNSILRRKSLAGHGSAWESGVRRSTRIRVKPLQFWRGERFLYGRIHDSLATVIGIKKYETPPNGGNKTVMKVKSYVSEEYADLVAEAALY